MRGARYYIGCALLTFLDRGVLSDIISAPKPYKLWNRDPDGIVNASGPQTTANSTSLYPDSNFNVSEECILWDDTCQGDKQNAASIFFGNTLEALLENECFTVTDSAEGVVLGLDDVLDEQPAPFDSAQCPGGTAGVPPATSSLWSTLKSWMREPACASSSLKYISAVRQTPAQAVINGCCGPCAIGGPNVDVYYWPSPEANTSCLNIIGTSVKPPTEGATTDDGYTYWGYTTTSDASVVNQIVTTMVYTSINGVYFKMPMSNPWESNSGASTTTNHVIGNLPSTTLPVLSMPKIQRRAESPEATIQARANPIAIPNQRRAPMNESNGNTARNDSSPGSIVTYGSHTFTSPSVYVDFYSLSATDSCGYRGSTINSTLLAFDPGELSTVATAMYSAINMDSAPASVYDFNDLPCPPMSVMWSQWYKPEPGEPYRPLIVFPSKLLDVDPLWKICTPGYFTGYDPPRTLDPAAALVPKVTPPSKPNPDPGRPKPVATHDNLPRRTTTSADPAKTSSDPLLAKSFGSSGVQEDPSQKTDPPRDTKKASADPSSNNPGSNDSQEQSLQEDPNSSDPKNSPVDHALSHTRADSEINQPVDSVHPSKGASIEDGHTTYQPQPLVSSSLADMTTVIGGHHVSTSVEGYKIDGVDNNPGASPTTVSGHGQQIAVDSSNIVQVGGHIAHIDPAASSVIATIANHEISPLSKGFAIEGNTLQNGDAAGIIASMTFSLDASSNIFLDDHSYAIPKATLVPTTINGEAIMPLPTGISIHSTTLTPGAPALVIPGTSYSLFSSNNLYFGRLSYASPVMTADVDPTQVTTIAGQPVVEFPTGISIAGTTLTAGASATTCLSGVFMSLDSSNLVVGSVAISEQTASSSGSLPRLNVGGSSSQDPDTKTGISTSGSNDSTLAFTGHSEARKPDFSMLLSLFIGTWTVMVL